MADIIFLVRIPVGIGILNSFKEDRDIEDIIYLRYVINISLYKAGLLNEIVKARVIGFI